MDADARPQGRRGLPASSGAILDRWFASVSHPRILRVFEVALAQEERSLDRRIGLDREAGVEALYLSEELVAIRDAKRAVAILRRSAELKVRQARRQERGGRHDRGEPRLGG